MANQNDHKPMRRFDISARSMADFEALESSLKRQLGLYGQEGERVLSGPRDTVDYGLGGTQRTRTFYSDVSAEEAEAVLGVLKALKLEKKHGKPGDEGYEDPGIDIDSSEVDFTTGVNAVMDTSQLKRIMDFVKGNGGEFDFEKSGATSGTARWSLPSDLMVSGDRGMPVSAATRVRGMFREGNKNHTRKFQDLAQSVFGRALSKEEIRDLSDAYKAKLRRDAKTLETQKAQADNPEELETMLGQKLLGDRQRKRLKAQALFKDSAYTPEQIASGDFFDNDDVMDQIGSDIVGYPVAVQKGIRRARRRLADRDLEPEDYRRATYAALDRTNARIRDSRAWRESHPDEPLARQFREAEERRTPGTRAFAQAEQDRLDRSSERRKASVEWAKAHRGDPAAKAILRGQRKGAVNRLLRGVGAAARNTVLAAISAALASAVKFLSALPGVASDVRHISSKGNALAITDYSLRGYRHMEQITRMKEGTLAETFGALVHIMPDLATGNSRMDGALSDIAAVSIRDPKSQALAKTVEFGVRGGNPGDLWREYMNTAFRLAYLNKGHLGSEEDFSNSLRNSLRAFDAVAPGMSGQGADLAAALFRRSNGEQETVRRVAAGEAMEINGKAVNGLDVYGAMEALFGVDDSKYTPKDTATTVEWKASEQVAQTWAELSTAVGEIKGGVLVKILGATEGIAVWLRDILKTIMALPIFGGMFDAVLEAMDEEDYQKNLVAKRSLENQALGAEAVVSSLGKPLGMNTEADHAAALSDWKSGVGVPGSIQVAGLSGLYRSYVHALYDRAAVQTQLQGVNAKSSAYETGYISDPKDPTKLIRRSLGDISRPFGWRPEQMAASVANKVAIDEQPFIREVEKVITTADAAAASRAQELSELSGERDFVVLQRRGLERRLDRSSRSYASDAAKIEELREREREIDEEIQYKGPAAINDAWHRWATAREALAAATERMPGGEEVVTDTNGNPIALRRLSDYEEDAAEKGANYRRAVNALQAATMSDSKDFDGFEDIESKRIHDAYHLNIPESANLIDARVEADINRRDAQIESAVFKQLLDVIEARVGRDALRSVLGGEIVVRGVIKAEERTYTVELTDRNTGQTTVIKDVPNEVERNVDVSASFEFLGQNLPASSSAAGGE